MLSLLWEAIIGLIVGAIYCGKCVPVINRESMLEKAKLGRIATHSVIAV
jgi:hypothetical protein